MLSISQETILTALIALRADKLVYEYRLTTAISDTARKQYEDAIRRIDAAIGEINSLIEVR